ncbi:MAG: hypothetical protein AAFN93_22845, partial [Bacteroidota bacterium]
LVYLGGVAVGVFILVGKQLIQFQHAKGRATWDGSAFQYQYNLTDHARSFGVGALKVSCKSRLPRWRQRWKSQSRSHRRAGCSTSNTGLLPIWDESFREFCHHDFSRKSVSLQRKRKTG